MQEKIPKLFQYTAAVVIGRNEGQRLKSCIESLLKQTNKIVYVDSGSTDDSVEMVKKLGVDVVNLGMSMGFTAARARNAGFFRATQRYSHLAYIQFVDGDCQVDGKWLEAATEFLETHVEIAAASGRRKEMHPEKSVYNYLCDIEWDTPIGKTKSCGGDVLMRVDALATAGGYREDLIAGEEPELCVRLRQKGWLIWRLDVPMTLHDAGMYRFSQWWKRTMRGGYAFAEGAYLHGAAPEYHWVVEAKRARVWGLVLPVIALITLLAKPLVGVIILLAYPLQVIRLTLKSDLPFKSAFIQAFFLTIGKFAEAIGQIKFFWHRYTNKKSQLIEYK